MANNYEMGEGNIRNINPLKGFIIWKVIIKRSKAYMLIK